MVQLPVGIALLICAGSAQSQTRDWSGAYAGATVSATSGDISVQGGSWGLGGSQAGLLLGYGLQTGQVVYGLELAYQFGDIRLDAVPDQGIERMIDLKARLGFVTGPVLLYGFVGASSGEIFVGPSASNVSGIGTSGPSYGLGADLGLGGRAFLGLEFQKRKLESDGDGILVPSRTGTESLSLRAGLRF